MSCSGDGVVLYTELPRQPKRKPSVDEEESKATLNYFNCHSSGTTYEVLTIPSESHSFMSCGEDGSVRLFDLRQISRCHKTCCKDNILILSPAAVTAMCASPISSNYIAIGCSDGHVRIYDRRYLELVDFSDSSAAVGPISSFNNKYTRPVKMFRIPSRDRPFRVTSINYSMDELELLVSYSSNYLYLFDVTRDGLDVNQSNNTCKCLKPNVNNSPAPVRRLRLRGDWSDTGPEARPERELARRVTVGQGRPQLQATIMNRMTEVLSRMLADPRTRIGLSSHGNEITHENDLVRAVQQFENITQVRLGMCSECCIIGRIRWFILSFCVFFQINQHHRLHLHHN